MDAALLRRLIGAASYADTDVAYGDYALSLYPEAGGTTGWFSGAYGACSVWVPGRVADRAIHLSGRQAVTLLPALPNEGEVDIEVAANSLALSTGGRRMRLRYVRPEFDPEASRYDLLSSPPLLAVPATIWRSALGRAGHYTASGYNTPILQGIRLASDGGRAQIAASDGYSLFWREEFPVQTDGLIDVVLSASVGQTLLPILYNGAPEGEDVLIRPRPGSVVVQLGDTALQWPCLQGNWPRFVLPPEGPWPEHVVITAATVRALNAAAEAYGSGPDAIFEPAEGGGVEVRTPPTEGGEYSELLAGLLTGTRRLARRDLDAVLRSFSGNRELLFRPGLDVARTYRLDDDGSEREALILTRA